MNAVHRLSAVCALLILSASGGLAQELRHAEEKRFGNIRQLTTQGENAEAYWAFDGSELVYQSTPTPGEGCDQIYHLPLEGGGPRLISTGLGRTTCSYFYPDGHRILYSSTHHHDEACPAPPDRSRGYVWPIYDSYDIFVYDQRTGELEQLTDTPGYDAEATVSPTGDRIVFTSIRSGDLDLFSMNLDGSDIVQLTTGLGYDGGAFFSPDGSKIVWRAHYPKTEEERADYLSLLEQGLIRPGALDIYVADADGSNARRLTDNGAANFAPYWHPSGEKVIFSSNLGSPGGREFDLYLIDLNGEGLERVTYTPGFDGFPVFSPDGTMLAFGSNRNESHPGNTNVFIAEWIEER